MDLVKVGQNEILCPTCLSADELVVDLLVLQRIAPRVVSGKFAVVIGSGHHIGTDALDHETSLPNITCEKCGFSRPLAEHEVRVTER